MSLCLQQVREPFVTCCELITACLSGIAPSPIV